jgi:hypothetical protein
MTKRIAVVRATGDRDEFVRSLADALSPDTNRLYVTDPDPRPATAVVVGPFDGDVLARYEVDERVLWDDGLEIPSYSMFAFFRPPSGLEGLAFVAEYRKHAEVARVQHPGIRRYGQDIVVAFEGEERWQCAGISELHFASRDEFRDRFWLDDASRDVIARDVLRFSDPPTAKQLVGAEIELGV